MFIIIRQCCVSTYQEYRGSGFSRSVTQTFQEQKLYIYLIELPKAIARHPSDVLIDIVKSKWFEIEILKKVSLHYENQVDRRGIMPIFASFNITWQELPTMLRLLAFSCFPIAIVPNHLKIKGNKPCRNLSLRRRIPSWRRGKFVGR